MEQHEGVYEQIIEVNNANQGAEFLSHQLVQEIVIQNESNQDVMSGIEIMLPNDCVQDQCNSNVVVSCNADGVPTEKQVENAILNEETSADENATQKNTPVNNVDDNSTNYSECSKEEKIEEYILQNEESYHPENFEVTNSLVIPNPDIDNKITTSETVVETSESIPLVNDGESVPDFSHNESTDNHNDVVNIKTTEENANDLEHKNVEDSNKKGDEVSVCTKELDSLHSVQNEKIEPLVSETISVNEVFNEKLVTTEESHLENHSSEQPITEADILGLDKSDESIREDKNSIAAEFSERDEYSVIVSEAVAGTKIDVNSDDVAVLTEFSSMDYNMQEEITEEHIEENHNETIVTESMEEKVSKAEKKTSEESKLINTEAAMDEDKSEKLIKDDLKASNTSSELADVDINETDDDDLELHLSTQSNDTHRKVIQDIFDDWQDENGEEENNQLSANFKEQQDSVEMELESLLSDGAQQEQTVSSTNSTEHPQLSSESSESTEKNDKTSPGKTLKSDKSSTTKNVHESPKTANKSPNKQSANASTKDHLIGRSPKNAIQDSSDSKGKLQSPRPGVKVPGLHLTSQIATAAEVNEVLKERLREKQKDLVTPKTADIVFVKKISQRLSSQLLSAATTNVPPLISLQTSAAGDSDNDKAKTVESTASESNKSTATTDNKELLAILEGDVDPDWSNLKPQTISDESNKEVHSGTKLDPVTERELALKQLLELPNISTKKNNAVVQKKNKKNVKQVANKSVDEQVEPKAADGDVIHLDSTDEDSPKKKKALKENNSQNTRSNSTPTSVELTVEESRSGRKRKLTEKAREHELTVKRQKVSKGKPVESKKSSQEPEETNKQKSQISVKTEQADSTSSSTPKSSQIKSEPKSGKTDAKVVKTEPKAGPIKTETVTTGVKGKLALKRAKLGVLKKDAPIVKRKDMAKNLIKQKLTRRRAIALANLQSSTRTVSPTKGVPEKPTSTTPGTKAKKVTEIDRLLQDEGVVNLLYNVEQPDLRKRFVPITKSQKKVMDVEKAERELKFRTKLVRNAVLRLRNSGAPALKISPRSRRNTAASPSEPSTPQPEKKVHEPVKSQKVPASTPVPSDFIIPAKIRNAADASRIIRRHSSSSFSSASASPRVSVDQPPEQLKIEESEIPTKTKRKSSQDTTEKVDVKKNKKKVSEEKEAKEKSPEKELVKKMTRSNVASAATAAAAAAAVVKAKNKKVPKSKTSSESSSSTAKSPVKNQEELSACLAEAASVLSNISGSSRGANSSINRKKGSTNVSKSQADDEKVDGKKLFSNKEINVRQHGHLVQLILTPSTPISGIRNAITIQVMNELREALSILKNDDDCRVVLFTSTGTSFCEGLELSSLLHSNKEERKTRAEEMSDAVKEFVRTLASFNKPIVAGVQGAAIGLGVTMLPLFDLVIASDKATFSTPYGKLGQIAEGAAVLTLSHSLGTAVTNELLLGGRVLTASEALRAGLVTRVLWPDRFQGELLPSLKSMSEQSSQSMEATKALLRQSLRDKLDASLDSESLLLVQQWCSSECQQAIKAFIEEKGQ